MTAALLALLEQLDEARAKATPGPWHWDPEFGEKNDTGLALTNDAGAEIVGAYNTHCCDFRDDPTVEDADAALIVAAVNALPQLTAALRAVVDAADGLNGWRHTALRYADHSKEDAVTAAMARARALAYERATARIRAAITAALTPEPVQP